MPFKPLTALASFGAIQGVLDPITPIGRDAIIALLCRITRVMGYDYYINSQKVLYSAGERLFIDISALLRNPIGRRVACDVLGFIEPGTQQVVEGLLENPEFKPGKKSISIQAAIRVARLFVPLIVHNPFNFAMPERFRVRAHQKLQQVFEVALEKSKNAATLSVQLDFAETVWQEFPGLLFLQLIPNIGLAVGLQNLLNHLASSMPGGRNLALEIDRSLSHNVTSEMDLELWQTAQQVCQDEVSKAVFLAQDVGNLSRGYKESRLPAVAQKELNNFLDHYGFRGPGEIDLGRPRWQEDPEPLIKALQNLLRITEPSQAPDQVFQRGAERVKDAIEEFCQALLNQRG